MTPKAEALLDAVTCVTKPCDHHLVSEPLRLLVAYIEELERKVAEHDKACELGRVLARRLESERTDEASGDSPWCSAHRD